MTKMNLSRRSLIVAVCIFLVAVIWAVFGQTLDFPFINVDDPAYVVKNPPVSRGLTSHGILWAFSSIHSANWHPLTWISHMIDCQFYGLNPRGHHFTNLLLHAVTAVVLFLVLLRTTKALWRSAFVAVVFAIHPLRAESVAWIAERKDVLSGLFFMLTIASYVRYTRRLAFSTYLLVAVLLVAGLMCKPMLVTLPLILLLLDFWPLNRFSTEKSSRLLLEKLPLLACSLAIAIITLFAQQESIGPGASVPVAIRMSNAVTSCCVYLRQVFWPSHLAAFYPFRSESYPTVILSLLVVTGISAAVVVLRARKYLVTGWFWYLVMLVPVIGIIQVGEQSHADRYTYLPQIGLYIALTWAVSDLCARLRRPSIVLAPSAVIIVVALTLTAREQTARWQNSEKLWRSALAVTPDNPTVRRNLAQALQVEGRFDEALTNYQRALAFDPDQVIVHSNLGALFLEMGKANDAIDHLQTALKLQPKYVEAESNLGLALFELGKVDESISHFERAIEIDPGFADAHYNLGNSFLDLGDPAEAVSQYRSAIDLDPTDERALNNLAWILATSARDEIRNGKEALEYAKRADTLTQNQKPLISATLAAAYAETGQFEEAARAAAHAAELASAQGNAGLAEAIRAQLHAYHSGLPFRDQREGKSSR